MRERLTTLIGALAALCIVYVLFFGGRETGPPPAKPVTEEPAADGLRALYLWLTTDGIPTVSLRQRYPALGDSRAIPRPTGNVMLTVLPFLQPMRDTELPHLIEWVQQGNTLLVAAALNDTPTWSRPAGPEFLDDLQAITGLSFSPVRRPGDDDGSRRLFEDTGSEQEYSIETHEGHPLLRRVASLTAFSDFVSAAWQPDVPEGRLVLELATMQLTDTPMIWQTMDGEGLIIIVGSGTMFSNRAIARADNRRFVANVVENHLAPGGTFVFDDMHQGLTTLYDPDAFFADPRLHATLLFLVGFWLVYVAGTGNRLVDPAPRATPLRQSDFVEATGAFISRHMKRRDVSLWLYQAWFDEFRARLQLPRNGQPVWDELGRVPTIDPRLLARMQGQYRDISEGRRTSLVDVYNTIHRAKKEIG